MEEYDFYPQKPDLIEPKSKGNLALTIFSIVLFVMTFLFVFTNEVNFVFNLLIVLLIHEFGHFSMMKFFKYTNVRMLFIPLMGAFVQGSKVEYSQKQSMIVAGAGPFPGVVLGVVLILLSSQYKDAWMIDLGLLFLLLNIINLIPLDPLDGGQLLKLLMKKYQEMFILIFSFVSSLVLIGVGWAIDSWVIMIFGFVMGFRVRSFQRQYQLRKELKADDINYNTTYKSLSNKDFSKIKQVILSHTPALRTYVDNVSIEESDPLIASQVSSVLLSPVINDASFIFKFITVLLWIASLSLPFIFLILYMSNENIRENYEWYFKLFSIK